MRRYVLTLDLVDDAGLIAEYEAYHRAVWPEVADAIRSSGIGHMEIYRYANRMFMIIETTDAFSFENKAALDAANPKVQQWEQLMWNYQQALPGAAAGEKWMVMQKIYDL